MKKCILAAVLLAMLVCLSTGNAADTTKVFGTKGTGTYSYVGTTTRTAALFPNFGAVNKYYNAKTRYTVVLGRSNVVGYDLRSNDGGLITTPLYHQKGVANHTSTTYSVSIGKESAEQYSSNTQAASSMTVGGDLYGFQYSVDFAVTDGYAKTFTNAFTVVTSETISVDVEPDRKTGYYAYCYGSPYRQYRTNLTITSSYGTVKETVYYNLPTTKTLSLYLVKSRDCVNWTVAE